MIPIYKDMKFEDKVNIAVQITIDEDFDAIMMEAMRKIITMYKKGEQNGESTSINK